MKKKIAVSVLILVLVMVCALFALVGCADRGDENPSGDQNFSGDQNPSGDDNSYGLNFELNDGNDSYTVKGLKDKNNYGTAIKIPSEYKGLPVTKIGESAFNFNDENKLVDVEIADSVKIISYSAFGDCLGLKSIKFGDDSQLERIENSAFKNCRNLPSVELPKGLQSIGNAAFSGCVKLQEVSLGDSVEVIDSLAFGDCGNLLNFRLPNNLTVISSGVFNNCAKLNNIVIPNSVIEIGDNSFKGCGSLTNITLPINIEIIYSNAFANCDNLTIDCEASEKPSGWSSNWYRGDKVTWGFNNVKSQEAYDYVVRDQEVYLTKFKSASQVVEVPETIGGKKVVSIGNIFNENNTITSVTLPKSIRRIGAYAFYNCESLTNIQIAEGVTVIGDSAFSGCAELQEIVIPDSVLRIETMAFESCVGMREVVISENLEFIGHQAFAMCSGLTVLNLPESLKAIDALAFAMCENLEVVVIPKSVLYMDLYIFLECKKLTVNCLLDEKPEGWRDGWDISSTDFDTEEEYTHFEVVWGYKAN